MLFSPNAAGPAKSLVPVEIERPVMRKRAELHWHKMWRAMCRFFIAVSFSPAEFPITSIA
ncbi:hypothetical protein OUZ56_001346 [Daphnia magna]|uniref:Uncharacterized protein n=1 Tax=Daphnia magna TaxID=35525 RepID=A0ABR0A2D6_9CRUS|nr:hypothetical protein OUZ56_001346 [Daphnia magna]